MIAKTQPKQVIVIYKPQTVLTTAFIQWTMERSFVSNASSGNEGNKRKGKARIMSRYTVWLSLICNGIIKKK